MEFGTYWARDVMEFGAYWARGVTGIHQMGKLVCGALCLTSLMAFLITRERSLGQCSAQVNTRQASRIYQ